MWLHLIHEGSSGKRIVYWITRSLCVICELFRDTLVVFQKDQKWWNTRLFPAYRRSTSFTEEFRGILNPFWGVDWFWWGKENDKARQAVFFTPLNQFGNDTDEEKLHGDHTVPQKVHYQTCWKRNQDAVYWIHFIQTAGSIITNATVPRDCTDRVISQNWDRVIFERVATPRPAPKVTLKSNWLTKQKQQQQPQQPTLEEGVKAGVRDDTKKRHGSGSRAISKVDVGTHLIEHQVITDAFSNHEANAQEFERVKIGSNKMCVREDLPKKRWCSAKNLAVPFSKWAMWSSIQCQSCLHYVFERTLIRKCGKLIQPDQDVMNRIKDAFENPQGTMLPHISDCHKR